MTCLITTYSNSISHIPLCSPSSLSQTGWTTHHCIPCFTFCNYFTHNQKYFIYSHCTGNNNKYVVLDINECKLEEVHIQCPIGCVNTEGSYYCAHDDTIVCAEGYSYIDGQCKGMKYFAIYEVYHCRNYIQYKSVLLINNWRESRTTQCCLT